MQNRYGMTVIDEHKRVLYIHHIHHGTCAIDQHIDTTHLCDRWDKGGGDVLLRAASVHRHGDDSLSGARR